ncbi:MAG: prephenate dehydrogenase [Candidatus Omnitrophica bacterium]|nr:prephenate dehydrogenase [Candidatus Omnitrophota bacterium]MDD5080814.1 prephenate dehydrogenase [Candidatus Omnitrophota bacterium]MDD5441753.1 prephenate dehydrogenase [Candidatus Omnitrophota bacterium]
MSKVNNIKKIAVIGVGLMGGSFCSAVRKRLRNVYISGYARSLDKVREYKKYGFMDLVSLSIKEVVNDADLVVFSLPVRVSMDYFKKSVPFLKSGAVIIDLGSTKVTVQNQAKKIFLNNEFIGCHPLCGSEKSSAKYSDSDMFEKQACIITGSKNKAAVKNIAALWNCLGSYVIFMTAAQHDKLLAGLSHLPHIIAYVLAKSVKYSPKNITLRSFQDLTRIADSSPEVWADICFTNRENIIDEIDSFVDKLITVKKYLKAKDYQKFIKFITTAQRRGNKNSKLLTS